MGRAAADVERHELWLWESWEEHLRLGFESAEFWQACNCWNWSYWLLLVLVVVPVNMAVELLQLHAERAFDAYTTVALGASVAAWLGCLGSLGLAPQRGHTVMVWVASSLFVLHYGNLFLVTEQCHGARQSHIACAKELVLTQPPLHLVVFVFSSCRLRPLLAVVVCGACCALSLLWSLSLTVRDVVESRGEVDAAQVHTAIGSVLCGVLLIFGAQAGASVFKRQKYIFEYLSDHASLTRAHGSSRLACDFDSIGGGARRFFASYLDRTLVTRFPDASADEEKRFARWRLASARAWLRRRGHYLVAGVGGLALPYLWLSWDQYARAELALSCATLQTAAMLLMLSAAVALGCRGGSEGWPVWVFMGAQLAFSASFLWCGGLGKVDSAPRVPRAVLPSDPFVFLVFSAHSMWSLGVRPILLFDLLVLGIFFAILASRAAHHVDELGVNVFTMSSRMLLVVVECLSLTLTLEKYDRVLWRLHSSASEAPVGSFASFASFAGAPSADRASSLQAPRDVRLSVVGFSAAYSDDVFYFIEVDASGYPPHVALRSVPALRAAFLRLLESGEAEAVPFLERSFDALVDATEPQLRRASLRLERILRRALPTADTACRVLGLRPDDAQRCPALAPRLPVPRMDVLLLAVGSRGDVQVFISTARALSSAGHRCRLATHAQFEQLVLAAGVEFYPLATTDPVHWQPEQLMQHMEANPGLGPEMLLRPQDLVKMLLHTPEMTHALQQLVLPAQPPDREGLEPAVGPWAAAIQPDPRSGRPFTAQAVIANPPSFVHIHIAERLGIPCHLAFTMPWTATAEVGHPLSGPSTAQRNGNAYWHKMSYRWVDNLQWSLGRLGPFVNAFRREIGLAPISSVQYENAPSLVDELQVPFMYFFSRALLEKPPDWGPHIDVCGFLDDGGEAASGDATRPPALEAFLAAGAPPVYVGFGSISSDLEAIADAAVNAALGVGRRVVLQRGWGSLGSLHQRLPPDVFYVGRPGEEEELRERIAAGTAAVGALDHEWLFPRCRAVVHHGGCGTTQCGIRHARPCVVIAFFGDQPLWGGLVQHRGAGRLVLSRRATPRLLSEALVFACGGEAAAAAEGLRDLIREEAAAGAGLPRVVDSFHKQLPADLLACDVCAHMAHSSGGPRQEVRLARFFDTGSQLRLCDVCCYALFVHQAPEAAEGQPPPSARGPERLAVYRALDWGRGRRRWLRNLGASTAHAMEGVVAMPFVGLRSGGLVGAAVGGVAGLLNLLVAPISGARHLVNQLRSRDPLQEDPVSLQDMVHLRVDGGRLRVGAAGRAGDAVPGAAAEGLAGGRGEGPLFSRQQSDDEGLPISRRQGDLVARGEAQAGERIAPDDEAAVCSEIAEAFRGAIDFRERMLHVQAQGHEEFSAALAGADWSKGPASRALRSASGASSARSLPLLSPPPQRRGGSTSGAHGALLASPGCAGPPGAGAPG